MPPIGRLRDRVTIGKLRDRVTLLAPVPIADEYGQRIPTWVSQGDVWAQVEDLRGAESVVAGAEAMVTDHRVTIRFRADVRPDWRVVTQYGAELEIRAIVPDTKREFLALGCNVRT
jgi:SPP1 family predicted phage head-tail adaptor